MLLPTSGRSYVLLLLTFHFFMHWLLRDCIKGLKLRSFGKLNFTLGWCHGLMVIALDCGTRGREIEYSRRLLYLFVFKINWTILSHSHAWIEFLHFHFLASFCTSLLDSFFTFFTLLTFFTYVLLSSLHSSKENGDEVIRTLDPWGVKLLR